MKKLSYLTLLVLATVCFTSCSNEAIDETAITENVTTEVTLEEARAHDAENFKSLTYNGETYTIDELYANEEVLDKYMNAQVTFNYVEGNNDNEKSELFIFDSNSDYEAFNKRRSLRNDKVEVGIIFFEHKDVGGRSLRVNYKTSTTPRSRHGNLPSNFNDITSSLYLYLIPFFNKHEAIFSTYKDFNRRNRTLKIVAIADGNVSTSKIVRRDSLIENDKISSWQIWVKY